MPFPEHTATEAHMCICMSPARYSDQYLAVDQSLQTAASTATMETDKKPLNTKWQFKKLVVPWVGLEKWLVKKTTNHQMCNWKILNCEKVAKKKLQFLQLKMTYGNRVMF